MRRRARIVGGLSVVATLLAAVSLIDLAPMATQGHRRRCQRCVQLYDLETDPHETRDLAAGRPDLVRMLVAELADRLIR